MAVTGNNFDSAVTAWCRKSEARMEAVLRESCQRLTNAAQANVPVDTGFLKSSAVASEGAPMPMRPDSKGVKGQNYSYDGGQVIATIANLRVGGPVFFFCYTAIYARVVEFGGPNRAARGYVRLAAQRWRSIVSQVCREARSRAST